MKTLFLLLIVLTLNLSGEDAQPDTDHGAATQKGRRLTVEGKLTKESVRFLAKHFPHDEDFIREQYETSLPAAIEKVIQNKDEADISKMLAKLVGTINAKQAKLLIEDTQAEIKRESEGTGADKSLVKLDLRYVTLMERLQWAALSRLGTAPDDEKAKEFNAAFKEPYDKIREWNKTANEKLKQAADGIPEAKQWVRDNISMKSVLKFAEGQKKTGDAKAGDRIIKALSFEQAGERFLDMWGTGKEAQRLYLGKTDASLSSAVDGFLDVKKSFGANIASRKLLPNDTNLRSWYMKSGKFTKGAPKGFAPKVTTSTETVVDTNIARLEVMVGTFNCRQCHDLTIKGTSLLDATVDHPRMGSTRLVDLPARISESTEMKAKLTPELKAVLEEFARIQRGAP